MNRDRIARLEERIEQLVEGSFARLFNDRLQPREVAVRLARAVEDNVRPLPDGGILAPNLFVVCLHVEDLMALQKTTPDLAQHLAATVIDFANRAGLVLSGRPVVEICQNDDIAPRSILITATHNEPLRSTQILTPVDVSTLPPPAAQTRPPHLIYQGRVLFTLDRNVVNIGRKRENHIVLDDPRVSRKHAQIRFRFGRYVLYDLGSTGGTTVNGHRITETILQPGDVISLSGVMLVFVEDDFNSTENRHGDTQLRARHASDDPDSGDANPAS